MTSTRVCTVTNCSATSYARGFCVTHYRRMLERGTTDDPNPPTFEQRFWAKVNKDGPTPHQRPELGPCWVWTASLGKDGYGHIHNRGAEPQTMSAHRAAYIIEVGPIPDGLELDHLCLNQRCVNPKHLEPVTHLVNMRRYAAMRYGRALVGEGE